MPPRRCSRPAAHLRVPPGARAAAPTGPAKSSASAGGGLNALVTAAKKEGTLNVIALPPTWANYGNILKAFTAKYGIKINSALLDGSSQQEVNAIKSEHGTAKAPDVVDVGQAVALANTSLFAPYQVATWSSIPSAQKESTGLWYEDYGGYMAVGYSSSYGTISSLNDLLSPKFKGAVALNGNPTSANAALNGVMMASLAEGGTAGSITQGVDFFKKLKAAGNFNPVQATGATIKAGTTKVVFNWDYLNLPSYVGVSNWRCSSRRTRSWAGTTRRPSTRARRTRPRPGCGRSSSTPRPPTAGRTSGSRAAPGRWSSRPCSPTAPSTRPRPPAARGERHPRLPHASQNTTPPTSWRRTGRRPLASPVSAAATTQTGARPARAGRRLSAPSWVGTVPFLAYVAVFLLWPTGIVVVDSFKNPAGGWAFSNITKLGDPLVRVTSSDRSSVPAVVAVLGAVLGAILAYAIASGDPDGPMRRLYLAVSGVLAQFGGVTLAFAFLVLIGPLGLLFHAGWFYFVPVGHHGHLHLLPDPADGAGVPARHRRGQGPVAGGLGESRLLGLAVLAVRGRAAADAAFLGAPAAAVRQRAVCLRHHRGLGEPDRLHRAAADQHRPVQARWGSATSTWPTSLRSA